MNTAMDISTVTQNLNQFTTEMDKFSIAEEMFDDLIDEFDNDDEIEQESDAALDQVLAELGLAVGNSLPAAPQSSSSFSSLSSKTKMTSQKQKIDADIENEVNEMLGLMAAKH